jgi:putative oxidoreductase
MAHEHSLSTSRFDTTSVGVRLYRKYTVLEALALRWIDRHVDTTLRLALGGLFLWFGVLKLLEKSPAAQLVTDTFGYFGIAFSGSVFVLGAVETLIGTALCFGLAPRVTLLLFAAQQIGTFSVLIVAPELSFQGGNPVLLTLVGEFVVKNVVLLTAGLSLARRITPRMAMQSEEAAY